MEALEPWRGRDGGGSGNIDADSTDAIAGKPAPTLDLQRSPELRTLPILMR
ncbi:hypothetical protein METHPM2_1140010 [Pseudomonas sp. PM2]